MWGEILFAGSVLFEGIASNDTGDGSKPLKKSPYCTKRLNPTEYIAYNHA